MKLSHQFSDKLTHKWVEQLQHGVQHALHLPWGPQDQSLAPNGALVLAVTLVSVAAAVVLVVAP